MTRDRRWGIAVVIAAALALLVVTRVSGRDLPGEAVTVPPIPVPAAGACVDASSLVPVEVPCSEPHTGEVIEAWPAGHKPDADSPAQPGGACMIVFAEITPDGAGWSPPPYQVRRMEESAGGPVGWEGCVQEPTVSESVSSQLRYTGRLLNRSSITEFPPQMRSCAIESPNDSSYSVSCTTPHDWELLAVNLQGAATSPCEQLARSVVGSGSAFEGRDALTAGVVPGAYGSKLIISWDDPNSDQSADDGGAAMYVANAPTSCGVRAPAGKKLVASVVGLGDRPVPLG